MVKSFKIEDVIKDNLGKCCLKEKFGYEIPKNGGRCFENYYTNDAFAEFVTEMKSKYPQHYERYDSGKGSELKENNGRYGRTPPKMASVASSSRFCYLALRNGGAALGAYGPVMFEFGCEIEGINRIPPQLDAYFPEDNIFVEAKCQEILTAHKPVLKKAYWELIYGENNRFGFVAKEKEFGDEFEIPLSEFGIDKKNSMFDIKQFLCHLMGIASRKPTAENPATLVYLFFVPKSDDNTVSERIEATFCELRKEIKSLFESEPIKRFTEKNNIKLAAVAEHDYIMRDLSAENRIVLFP